MILNRRTLMLAAACPNMARALTPGALRFPRDHGSHPDTRTEWWYLTGWLQADDGSAVNPAAAPLAGFQLTFFRSRTGLAAGHPSAFAARQLLFGHAALTELPSGRLLHDQRSARAGLGLAEARLDDTGLLIDSGPRAWSLERRSKGAHSRYLARLHSPEFALDLQARSTQPLLLQGNAGWSRKGPQPQQASRYYTQPQLAVQGQLRRAGQVQAVRGTAWLDHEWSDELLAPGVTGWDWIGMNLFDGSTLTAFQLRDKQQQAVWAGGSWRKPGQSPQVFDATTVRFEAASTRWTSPTTAAAYPSGWRVHTPTGVWQVRPLAMAQELDVRRSTGSAYWEGLSELLDPQGRVVGRGYLEMTGYAGALKLG